MLEEKKSIELTKDSDKAALNELLSSVVDSDIDFNDKTNLVKEVQELQKVEREAIKKEAIDAIEVREREQELWYQEQLKRIEIEKRKAEDDAQKKLNEIKIQERKDEIRHKRMRNILSYAICTVLAGVGIYLVISGEIKAGMAIIVFSLLAGGVLSSEEARKILKSF